jgi:hypothetical protein
VQKGFILTGSSFFALGLICTPGTRTERKIKLFSVVCIGSTPSPPPHSAFSHPPTLSHSLSVLFGAGRAFAHVGQQMKVSWSPYSKTAKKLGLLLLFLLQTHIHGLINNIDIKAKCHHLKN